MKTQISALNYKKFNMMRIRERGAVRILCPYCIFVFLSFQKVFSGDFFSAVPRWFRGDAFSVTAFYIAPYSALKKKVRACMHFRGCTHVLVRLILKKLYLFFVIMSNNIKNNRLPRPVIRGPKIHCITHFFHVLGFRKYLHLLNFVVRIIP